MNNDAEMTKQNENRQASAQAPTEAPAQTSAQAPTQAPQEVKKDAARAVPQGDAVGTAAQLDILIRLQKKSVLHSRLRTVLTCCTLVLVLFLCIMLTGEMKKIDDLVDNLTVTTEIANEKLNDLDMDELTTAITSLTAAADTLGELDMDDFNKGVEAFSSAVEKFEELDMESLNNLVSSLADVTSGLQAATNALTGIFKK